MTRVLLFAVFSMLMAPQTQSPQLELEARLIKAEALWKVKKPAAYQFSLRVGCFCPGVEKAQVFRVSDGKSVPTEALTETQRRLFAYYDTVDKLFNVIRERLSRAPFKITAQFDPVFGYPTNFYYDYSATIADDELTLTISGFKGAESLNALDGKRLFRFVEQAAGRSVRARHP